MKYILNETPIRTTNGFNVNNIKVDLNVPENYIFHEYNTKNVDIKSSEELNFTSNIGLDNKKYLNSKIDINKNIDQLMSIEYIFNGEDHLVDNIDITIKENLKTNIFINYTSNDNNYHFHNGNINIVASENSSLNLTILNSLNSESVNLIAGNINCGKNSCVKINLIDLSGKVRIYNFKSNTLENSRSDLNNIYIGKNNEVLDLNYHYINKEINSQNNIEVQGILDDKSIKTFKGTIDFKENSKKSIGHENEHCLLLSNTCISKSLPILLCHEEDVDGAHSVSSGKIDTNKLFYLMSRGLTSMEAKKLIIKSNFNAILTNVPEEILDLINNKIDEII